MTSFPRHPHGPVSAPLPNLAQTWHSKIEIRDENRCFRNQVLVAAA